MQGGIRMTASAYYLGVDIGTTSTKAVLFTKNGKAISKSAVHYPLHTPNPLVAEQDPNEIFQAVVTTIKEAMQTSKIHPKALKFVAFSSAMHSLIAVDEVGNLLTNSITWADTRSAPYAKEINDKKNGHEIYLRTGTPVHPMSPLAKLLWLRTEEPALFQRAHKFISIKEYIFSRLFHSYVIDYSIASATGLLNLEALDWDEEALQVAGITSENLSTLVPTTKTFTGVDEVICKEMGIDVNTPFLIGASDGVLSNLGVNAIESGITAVTIGTSGAIRTVTDKPKTDPLGRTFCYALTEKHWVIGGPVNNGGMILRWVRDELAASEVETAKRLGMDPYDVLTKMAEGVAPGSDGLLFHPFMTGERAPLWDANARASFFGLSIHHQKQHMVRAVLEGVMFNLRTVLLAVTALTGEPKQIQATGGFARSAMWRQLMADVFHKPVVVPESYESSCLGAIVLGMYATGEIDDFSVVSEMIGATHTHQPNEAASAVYEELLPLFTRLPQVLKAEYENIANFQRKHVNNAE